MLLPKKVGSFTLMRKLDADGLSESFVAILDDPAGKQVVARRILPVVARDTGRIAHLRARVGDLRAARHASLVPVVDLVEGDGDLYVLEDWSDGIELSAVIHHCITNRTTVPHNVYLNLATQVCNALEALHGRPGTESGSENVLHLAMAPAAMWVAADGRVTVGRYGLARSPTAIATAATGALPAGVEYLAPEQTHQDQKLTPASDIFSLGAILYELLTLKPMFRADSSLQTIHRVRRAEVTTQLLEVKEIMPGLDKVLFRALSLNPRHRYQRAFVLREDLRGLMAGYSFNEIDTVTRAFLAPIARAKAELGAGDEIVPAFGNTDQGGDTTGFLLGTDPFGGQRTDGKFASGSPGRFLTDEGDATDALLRDPDSDVEAANTDRNAAYDPEEVDTAQDVRSELRAAFNTDDSALRAPLVEPRTTGRGEGRADWTDAGADRTNSERTKWVPQKVSAEPAAAPKRPITSVETGWSRIPSREDDRVAVPQVEPLERATWAPDAIDNRKRDADTGAHENTTNLLEPTTGPLPPTGPVPGQTTDTIDLGDPDIAPRTDTGPYKQVDDTVPAPAGGEPDTVPHSQQATVPLNEPETLEVNADTIDTAPVKHDGKAPASLAQKSALRPSATETQPVQPATGPVTDRIGGRPSGVTTWLDRADAPRPTITPMTQAPTDGQTLRKVSNPLPEKGAQAVRPPSTPEPSKTLEVDEPWADIPTSPQMAGDTDAFRSGPYEVIPTADHPIPGMTGAIPRPFPLEAPTSSEPATRGRFQPTGNRPADPVRRQELEEDDDAPQRSFVPVAVAVLAGAVFLAVCAGIGGGGILSWMATSQSGLLASDGPDEVPVVASAAGDPSPLGEQVPSGVVVPPVPSGAVVPPVAVEPDPAVLAAEQARIAQAEVQRIEAEAQAKRDEEARLEEAKIQEAKLARMAEPTPVPRPPPVPVQRPDPVPRPNPVPVARPTPPPTPKAAPVPRPVPVARVEAPPPAPPDETWDAVAEVDPAAAPSAIPTTELDRWSESAFEGELSPSALTQLAEVPKTDPGFTRARTLMYLDAKARGDDTTRDQHLAAMMALPENRYNPILLVETAQIAIDHKEWQQALRAAQTAEQHWARIPSELVFSRKAMIYEIEALAQTGMFYGSDSEDRDRLAQAIRGWERYRSHVQTKARADLLTRADEHLEQLNEIQRRLE